VLSVLIFCSQFVFGQSKTIRASVVVKDSTLKVELKTMQAYDCLAGPGSISISATGGSGHYKFSWTGPSGFVASTQNLSNLQAGNYTLVVSDGNCSFTGSWEIVSDCQQQYCTLAHAPVIVNATNCNSQTGSVTPNVSGGSGDYAFTWYDSNFNTISNGKNLTGVKAGYYILFAEDRNNPNCGTYFYYTINSNFKLNYTATANASCAPPYSGAATTTVSGGSGNYQYQWRYPNGTKKSGGNSITHLRGGSYQVTVTDVTQGCSLQQSIYIFNPANGITVTGIPTPNTICSPGNGAVDISLAGGSGNYTYTWFDANSTIASTAQDIRGALPGQYTLLVNDTSSGCTAYKSYSIADKTPRTLSLDSTVTANTNCSPPFNGAISISPKGVLGGVSYAWSSPSGFTANTQTINALAPDEYEVLLTDSATGCTRATRIVVPDQSLPSISINFEKVSPIKSCVSPDGAIAASVTSSNNNAYTLSWTGPETITSTGKNLPNIRAAGTYTLTATVMCNRTPVIAPPVIEVTDQSVFAIRLSDFVTDIDNNLDTASFRIVQKPLSGAAATLRNGMLQLDYKNVMYSGVDKLTIKACDLLNACSENVLTVTVDPTSKQPKETTGDIVVYNAVSANNDNLNSYLRIENVEQHPSRVFIYNRWGDQVFAVDNYDNTISCRRFEGISNDGKHLPTGTYFYKIEFTDNNPTVTGFLALTTE